MGNDQMQFILSNGIACRQCLTEVGRQYTSNEDERELDKILMSSNVEAFEYMQN